jgi:hypothetical protein
MSIRLCCSREKRFQGNTHLPGRSQSSDRESTDDMLTLGIQLFTYQQPKPRQFAADGAALLTLSKQTSNVAIRSHFAMRNFSHRIVHSISPGSRFFRSSHRSVCSYLEDVKQRHE